MPASGTRPTTVSTGALVATVLAALFVVPVGGLAAWWHHTDPHRVCERESPGHLAEAEAMAARWFADAAEVTSEVDCEESMALWMVVEFPGEVDPADLLARFPDSWEGRARDLMLTSPDEAWRVRADRVEHTTYGETRTTSSVWFHLGPQRHYHRL